MNKSIEILNLWNVSGGSKSGKIDENGSSFIMGLEHSRLCLGEQPVAILAPELASVTEVASLFEPPEAPWWLQATADTWL